MIDILILALPQDRTRAAAILDTMHEEKIAGPNRTRFLTEHPMDAGWSEAVHLADICPCVIFCWSSVTASDDAVPFRALGKRVLAAGHALSVELDPRSLPAEMANSSCYPFYSWRSQMSGWGRFVFGNSALRQIAAAAARKASGQDPPLPQAFWTMVRAQAWAALVGLCALVGTLSGAWSFYQNATVQKYLHPADRRAFEEMKAKHTCAAVRTYFKDKNNEKSPWQKDAMDLRDSCHWIKVAQWVDDQVPIVVYGDSEAETRLEADDACKRHKTATVRITSVTLGPFTKGRNRDVTCHIQLWMSVEQEKMN